MVLPDDQTLKMPAAIQASSMAWKKSSKLCSTSWPHELLMMWALDGSGLFPRTSVGASSHQPDRSSDSTPVLSQQPFVAIHCASGATPTWLAPSSPTMVPMVCVPCPLSSHGASAHVPRVAIQL